MLCYKNNKRQINVQICVVGRRQSTAGELEENGQRLLTTHTKTSHHSDDAQIGLDLLQGQSLWGPSNQPHRLELEVTTTVSSINRAATSKAEQIPQHFKNQ